MLFHSRALGNRKETWETLDPYGLVDELVRANVSGLPEIELKKLFKEARCSHLFFI